MDCKVIIHKGYLAQLNRFALRIRLNLFSSSRKGKSVARSHSSVSSFLKSEYDADDGICATFDASPFGQLLGMLSCSVIRRSSVLTDKLLRLLSYISLAQPDKKPVESASTSKTSQEASTSSSSRPNTVGPEHIQLAVQVNKVGIQIQWGSELQTFE